MVIRCGDLDVSCFEWGRGDPLVLVHGLADDHRAWRKVLPWLALDHRVIAHDIRGHGQTPAGSAEGTVAQLAGDLVALLDALELEAADLCGFSLGGTIVMRAAIDHPDRVRRLLPVATSSRVGRAAAEWYRQRVELAERGPEALRPELEADTRAQFENAPQEFDQHWRIRVQSTANPAGFANGCRAMVRLHEEPLDAELGRIEAPTLVISAELDRNCPPRAGQIICEHLAGARLEVIAGSGHQVEVEKPAELSALVLGFLSEEGEAG
jgi:pimeloyl-ACP methyl ester carboxylesterase